MEPHEPVFGAGARLSDAISGAAADRKSAILDAGSLTLRARDKPAW
jgi:hypothetical protein